MAKIATVDNTAMNTLYASEIGRATGTKVAADAEQAQDAFKDHEEFIALVESVLADDKNVKGSTDANDPDFD